MLSLYKQYYYTGIVVFRDNSHFFSPSIFKDTKIGAESCFSQTTGISSVYTEVLTIAILVLAVSSEMPKKFIAESPIVCISHSITLVTWGVP